jgi:hypothetical protein
VYVVDPERAREIGGTVVTSSTKSAADAYCRTDTTWRRAPTVRSIVQVYTFVDVLKSQIWDAPPPVENARVSAAEYVRQAGGACAPSIVGCATAEAARSAGIRCANARCCAIESDYASSTPTCPHECSDTSPTL